MPKRLLLIDDDEEDALFFSDALNEINLPIVLEYFESGIVALDKLNEDSKEHPDIIFLDVNMPLVNGWDCLREIKKITGLHEIPIVMYSTADLHRQGIIAEDIGAAALFKKANSFGELKQGLESILNTVLRF